MSREAPRICGVVTFPVASASLSVIMLSKASVWNVHFWHAGATSEYLGQLHISRSRSRSRSRSQHKNTAPVYPVSGRRAFDWKATSFFFYVRHVTWFRDVLWWTQKWWDSGDIWPWDLLQHCIRRYFHRYSVAAQQTLVQLVHLSDRGVRRRSWTYAAKT